MFDGLHARGIEIMAWFRVRIPVLEFIRPPNKMRRAAADNASRMCRHKNKRHTQSPVVRHIGQRRMDQALMMHRKLTGLKRHRHCAAVVDALDGLTADEQIVVVIGFNVALVGRPVAAR